MGLSVSATLDEDALRGGTKVAPVNEGVEAIHDLPANMPKEGLLDLPESGVLGVTGDSGIMGMVPVLKRELPESPVGVRFGVTTPLSSLLTCQRESTGCLLIPLTRGFSTEDTLR